jgi:hypothetical protein
VGVLTEFSCDNLIDDDNDGAADCLDDECAATATCDPTETCDNLLDDDADGLVDCADPSCLGAMNCVESICDDLLDDDFDGATDCLDADCVSSPLCAPTELCANGIDDDGDTLVDCADPSCAGSAACTETLCGDGIDNDSDSAVDCLDADCASSPACVESVCDDGIDNDGDGSSDCTDSDCSADPLCLVEGGANCRDGIDNDNDGRLDCMDESCVGGPQCPGCDLIAVPFGGGTGSLGDPFLLCSPVHVVNLAPGLQSATGAFLLASSIDMSSVLLRQDGNSFEGVFEGNGQVISGLTVNEGLAGGSALFSALSGEVRNLVVLGGQMESRGASAAIALRMIGGTISNVGVDAVITGSGDRGSVGGLVADMSGGIIRDSRYFGPFVNALDNGEAGVGGIAGVTSATAAMERVSASGRINGGRMVGGLVGVHAGRIGVAVSSAAVGAQVLAGGVVGFVANDATIEDVLFDGQARTSMSNCGGVAGQGGDRYTVRRVLVTGSISPQDDSSDPIVARRSSNVPVADTFFDLTRTGFDASGSPGAIGLSQDEIQNPNNPDLDVLTGWFRLPGVDPSPLAP